MESASFHKTSSFPAIINFVFLYIETCAWFFVLQDLNSDGLTAAHFFLLLSIEQSISRYGVKFMETNIIH